MEKEIQKENIHKDHRKRLRARYMNEGIGSMAEHNIVELLLFYGIPYKDTNETAHKLMESFGSLNGILDASADELTKVAGIGENTAVLLKLVRDIAVKYNENKLLGKNSFAGTENIEDYLRLKYADINNEILFFTAVDATGKIVRSVKICEGETESAVPERRTVAEAALRCKTRDVFLSHNHPNGFAVPSRADVEATIAVKELLESIDIRLRDHIIVGKDDCFSMAESKKYSSIFI